MTDEQGKLLCYVVDNSQEMIVSFDEQGCINNVNDRTCELTGYSRKELYGMYIGEPPKFDDTHHRAVYHQIL